ncbi:MAG: hypothetical protein KJP22_05765 [Acidimicrobiia bacterium]|nr:hypothetical protein [Acidimicrobiia bacterium]MBT8192892.1 hypothetical protein [Acidimicrobiia bacterium]
MAFDRVQVEAVIERALELDDAPSAGMDAGAVRRIGDELGVSPGAMSQALAEIGAGRPGPLSVSAQATIPVPPAVLESALSSFLRLRGLAPTGSAVWQQASGWWPDLYRFSAVSPVAVTVGEADDATALRLTARLDRVWRVHLLAALLAPLALVLAVLGVGPGLSLGSVILLAAWVGLCGWTYLVRRTAVERRLRGALDTVANPAYRLHPW